MVIFEIFLDVSRPSPRVPAESEGSWDTESHNMKFDFLTASSCCNKNQRKLNRISWLYEILVGKWHDSQNVDVIYMLKLAMGNVFSVIANKINAIVATVHVIFWIGNEQKFQTNPPQNVTVPIVPLQRKTTRKVEASFFVWGNWHICVVSTSHIAGPSKLPKLSPKYKFATTDINAQNISKLLATQTESCWGPQRKELYLARWERDEKFHHHNNNNKQNKIKKKKNKKKNKKWQP